MKGKRGKQQMTSLWLPRPSGDGGGTPPQVGQFTARERTVLRRLLRGRRPRRFVHPSSAARRERAARRVRRRIIGGLSPRDVRSLLQILMELRL